MKRFLIALSIVASILAFGVWAIADTGVTWSSTSTSAPADAGAQCLPLGGLRGYRASLQAGQAGNSTTAVCNTQCLCVPVDAGWDVTCTTPACTAQCNPQPSIYTGGTTGLNTYKTAADAGTGNCIDAGAANCVVLDAGAGNCIDAGVGNIVCDPAACTPQNPIAVPKCNPQPPTADAGATVDAGTGNCVDAGAANTADGSAADAGTGNCTSCVPVDAGTGNCYAAPNCVDAGTGNCIDAGINNTNDAGTSQCTLAGAGKLDVWACNGGLARNKSLDLSVPSSSQTDCAGGPCSYIAFPDMQPVADIGGVFFQVDGVTQNLPDAGLAGGATCSPATVTVVGAKQVN